ncbi:MAG: pyruvate ferredoxin oxidoreductase [Fibrobacter sp.]|nr:pyruvate ferredoxin oxidoreductase [Fibrobacter sp.]
MTEIVWHGRGGQGAFTAARLLGIAASLYSGKFALSFPTFGPERRGAPVLGFTKIDDCRIADRSEPFAANVRLFLDKTLLDSQIAWKLHPGGLILVNSSVPVQKSINGSQVISIDATGLALKILGIPVVNTAMLGALAGIHDEINVVAIEKAIKLEMKSSIVEKNLLLLHEAYNLSRKENR